MHLERLEEATGWDAICTADGDPARAKPAPVLYLEALGRLGVGATRRSRSRTRRTASSRPRRPACSASRIPNEVTRELGLEEAGADLVLDSLADLPPETLFSRLEKE